MIDSTTELTHTSIAYRAVLFFTSGRRHPLHAEWPHAGSIRGYNSLLESPLNRSKQRLHSSALVGGSFASEEGANRFAPFAEEEAADALEADALEPESESGEPEALRL